MNLQLRTRYHLFDVLLRSNHWRLKFCAFWVIVDNQVKKNQNYKKGQKHKLQECSNTDDYWMCLWCRTIVGHFPPYTSNRLVKAQFFKNSLILHLCGKYHGYWIYCWSVIFCDTNISHFGFFLVCLDFLTCITSEKIKIFKKQIISLENINSFSCTKIYDYLMFRCLVTDCGERRMGGQTEEK